MTSKEKTIRQLEYLKNETEKEKEEYGRISLFSKLQLKYLEKVLEDLEVLEFIKGHYKMNGFNELIPIYLDLDDGERFNKLERWLENNE